MDFKADLTLQIVNLNHFSSVSSAMFDLVVLGLGAKFHSVIYLVACIPYHTGKATSGSPSPLSLIIEIAFSSIISYC